MDSEAQKYLQELEAKRAADMQNQEAKNKELSLMKAGMSLMNVDTPEEAKRKKYKDSLMGLGLGAVEGLRAAGKKKGGVIRSSASKRADGCAIKGKTKGRFV